MAAVLVLWKQDPQAFLVSKPLTELLGGLDNGGLRNLMLELAEIDPKAEDFLRILLVAHRAADGTSPKLFGQLVRDATAGGGKWYAMPRIERTLDRILNEALRIRNPSLRARACWATAEAMDEALERVDDSDGRVGSLVAKAIGHMTDALRKADIADLERRNLMEILLRRSLENFHGCFDGLEESCFALCRGEEDWKFLDDLAARFGAEGLGRFEDEDFAWDPSREFRTKLHERRRKSRRSGIQAQERPRSGRASS